VNGETKGQSTKDYRTSCRVETSKIRGGGEEKRYKARLGEGLKKVNSRSKLQLQEPREPDERGKTVQVATKAGGRTNVEGG